MKSCRVLHQQGMALMELVVSTGVAVVVLGGVLSASSAIYKSIVATSQYSVSAANESRLMDYVAQDLRRAVRVGMLAGGTNTAMKNYNNFIITEANILTINIPDYYGANAPNNSAGSTFKTTRYPRATLNTSSTYNGSATAKLNGIVPWTDAVTTLNGKSVTRFAPSSAGAGEIQVRYYRAARSASDPSICFFRAEYPAGATTPSQNREIAERISDGVSTTNLAVTGKNEGLVFRLQSDFSQRYRLTGATTGPQAFVEVSIRNPRRD